MAKIARIILIISVVPLLLSCQSAGRGAVTRPVNSAGLAEISEAEFDTVDEQDVWIQMRDGTRLLANITTPVGKGPWPTILVRTPYGRQFTSPGSYSERGYVFIAQATRSRDGSEGIWGAWEDDRDDGYDTLEWIASQPWSDGKVGMAGGSYLGQAQILAAASGHPALKCIVPVSPGSDGFSDFPFRGGVPMLSLVRFFYTMRGPSLDSSGDFPATATAANLGILPLSDVDEAWAGRRLRLWDRFMQVDRSSDMPTLDIWDEFAQLETSVGGLHIGGRWDTELMATRENFLQFSAKWREGQYLVFGPWSHSPNESSRYADRNYGSQAVISLGELILLFYEDCLKGRNVGMEQIPRVQVFATGADRWLALDDWPESSSVPVIYSLAALPDNPGRGALEPEPPSQTSSVEWRYDPNDAVGGNDVWFGRSTRLWYDPESGDNVLFVTQPFSESTLLSGPVELELWISSGAVDTDVFGLLTEIDEDGTVRALHQTSSFRVRYRNGYNNPQPMALGVPQRLVMPLADFAHLFEEGTRLGLAIRSELFPAAARNLGTMEPYATGTTLAVQNNAIHSGPVYPSQLRLSRLPIEMVADEDSISGEAID